MYGGFKLKNRKPNSATTFVALDLNLLPFCCFLLLFMLLMIDSYLHSIKIKFNCLQDYT